MYHFFLPKLLSNFKCGVFYYIPNSSSNCNALSFSSLLREVMLSYYLIYLVSSCFPCPFEVEVLKGQILKIYQKLKNNFCLMNKRTKIKFQGDCKTATLFFHRIIDERRVLFQYIIGVNLWVKKKDRSCHLKLFEISLCNKAETKTCLTKLLFYLLVIFFS